MKKSKTTSLQKLHPMHALGNAPAGAGEIRVERIETRLKPRVPFPHKHDFFHFLYLEAGSGWHEIDFKKFPAKGKQLFLVQPGQVHAWKLGTGTRGYVIEFTKSSLERSERNERLLESLNQTPALLTNQPANIAELLRMMFQEFTQAKPGYRAALEHLLAAFLIQVERQESQNKSEMTKPSSLTAKFQELVEKHFQKEHAVEFYAKQLGTTTKNLTTQVSRSTGKSAGTMIQDRCLVEAKRLLSYSDLTIAEIGYSLGFDDPNYFARFFKQRASLSPGEFRKAAAHSVPH